MRLVHISDIHWRGIQRHEEYTQYFFNLFVQLSNLRPDGIVFTGDLFHTKTQGITPEVIEKMVWMLNGLADVAPLYMILGNHDGNLTNSDRQDAVSPLVTAINRQDIFLFKDSIMHCVGYVDRHTVPVLLHAFSCFDKPGWSKLQPVDNCINIALFHGSVAGCFTDGEYELAHNETDIGLFADYQFAFLGDIHKQQYLSTRQTATGQRKPWIGYPGSLIQQNYGESLSKGFYVWDIKSVDDWDVEFYELENIYPYITLSWNQLQTIQVCSVAKNARIRITDINNIDPYSLDQTRKLFLDHGALEVLFKTDTTAKTQEFISKSVKAHKSSLRDFEVLRSLYLEFLCKNKFDLTTEELAYAFELLQTYLKQLKELDSAQDIGKRDVVWSIKAMNFSNLFCYGENNSIDFSKMNGLIGILGDNRVGKSSIPGVLMFGMFNTTDRGPVKSAYIINDNKAQGTCDLIVNDGETDYFIRRSATKNSNKRGIVDEHKATTTLDFTQIINNEFINVVSHNKDSRPDTDKEIRKRFGTAQDFLLTAFSAQKEVNRFLKEGPTERKAILNRFLDLDLFEKLFKFANDDKTTLQIKLKGLSAEQHEQAIQTATKALSETKNHLRLCEQNILVEQQQLEAVQTSFAAFAEHNIEQLGTELRQLQQQRSKLLEQKKSHVEKSSQLALEYGVALEQLEWQKGILTSTNVNDLQQEYESNLLLQNQIQNLNQQISKQTLVVDQQEKSVRKLSTVPCGDAYPQCRFIKDSHEDKKTLEQQRICLHLLNEQLGAAQQLQTRSLVSIKKMIDDYQSITKQHEHLRTTLEHKKEQMVFYGDLCNNIVDNLQLLEIKIEGVQNKLNQTSGNEYTALKTKLEALKIRISALEKEKAELWMRIGKLQTKIETSSEEKKASLEIAWKIKVINTVAQSFSKTGLPVTILESQLPAINQELEKILVNVPRFKIHLTTELGPNSLDVILTDATGKRVIELASGMEELFASLAIRTALVNLSSLPRPDFLIIDEGFGALDVKNLDLCMGMLQALKEQYKMVLIITHVAQIKEIMDKVIEIKQENGFSYINI